MTKLETTYNSRNSFQNWFMRTFRSKALASERAEIVAHGTDEETIMKVWEDAIQDSYAGPFLFARTLLEYSDGLIDALSKDSYERWMIRKDIDEMRIAKLRPMMISMLSNENAPSRLLDQFAIQHWEKNNYLPHVSDDDLNSIAKHKNLSSYTMVYLLYHGSIDINVLVLKTHVISNEELQHQYIKTGVADYRDILLHNNKTLLTDRKLNISKEKQVAAEDPCVRCSFALDDFNKAVNSVERVNIRNITGDSTSGFSFDYDMKCPDGSVHERHAVLKDDVLTCYKPSSDKAICEFNVKTKEYRNLALEQKAEEKQAAAREAKPEVQQSTGMKIK